MKRIVLVVVIVLAAIFVSMVAGMACEAMPSPYDTIAAVAVFVSAGTLSFSGAVGVMYLTEKP